MKKQLNISIETSKNGLYCYENRKKCTFLYIGITAAAHKCCLFHEALDAGEYIHRCKKCIEAEIT